MTPERWKRINRLCQNVFELAPERREAFLAEACADDAQLRREIETLLAADHDAGRFMADFPRAGDTTSAGDTTNAGDSPSAVKLAPGGRIGPYKLLRQLGEGGMSTVYLALRDDDQYRKEVAIKVIRRGMENGDRLHRFVIERQILASLDHPHIARLYDGGTLAGGLPYFVMEHVDGEPIDRFCDRQRLGLEERLRLFRRICAAVHYAHQNMVVHRDLKPSNILVTEESVPKLLDFGIAKWLDSEIASFGPYAARAPDPTAPWRRMMTPDYASPEQIRGESISTASDVYSLGVLLYELLSGRRPHRLSGLSIREAERQRCEKEPVSPSFAAGLGEEEERRATAAARGLTPGELRRQLKGDLDAVVAKALRVEPQERYSSAVELADDLQRHLEGRPVLARKGTLIYSVGKFLRRNRLGVGVAALVLLLVLTSAIALGLASVRLAHQRDKAEQIATFLEELLQASTPFALSAPRPASNRPLTASELLARGAARIEHELADQPELQASLMSVIGNSYRSMALYAEARPLLENALEIRRRVLGPQHPDLASSLDDLALLLSHQGSYEEAAALYRQALEIRRQAFGEQHPLTARTLVGQAYVMAQKGDYAAAKEAARSVLAMRERGLDPRDAAVVTSLELLSDLHVAQGDYQAAEDALEQALELWRQELGEDHPASFFAQGRLAHVLSAQGRYEEAENHSLRLLERWRTLGEEHPDMATAMNNLANVYYYQGKYAEAATYLSRALAINRRLLGPKHPQVITNVHNLATVLTRRGRYDEAIELHRENLELRREVQGAEHPRVANTLSRLAEAHYFKREHDEAEKLHRQALEMRRRLLGEDHPKVADSLWSVARVLEARGELGRAAPLYEAAVALARRQLDAAHPDLARYALGLAQSRMTSGEPDAALPLIREALEIQRQTYPAGDERLAETASLLGECLRRLGRPPETGAGLGGR